MTPIELRNAAQTLLNADGPHPKYVADIAYRKEAHPAAVISLLDQIQTLQAENERLTVERDTNKRMRDLHFAEKSDLAAKLVPLEADAERYRWLVCTEHDIPSRVFAQGKDAIDTFIDAAKGGQHEDA